MKNKLEKWVIAEVEELIYNDEQFKVIELLGGVMDGKDKAWWDEYTRPLTADERKENHKKMIEVTFRLLNNMSQQVKTNRL